ncbi:Zcf27p [Knufia obscura]|uniref:Zcf27p n=2 Tax=Knufia TaxID=430999 RepID=A0AAN8F0V7_9EURO|nr:Zcf27p [Knufia obscura]KAK5954598.1 Zcf27p [Knufia fluminis]
MQRIPAIAERHVRDPILVLGCHIRESVLYEHARNAESEGRNAIMSGRLVPRVWTLVQNVFDTASLAILEKLNTIEELLRKPNPTPPPQSPGRHDAQTPASIPSTLSAAAPEKPIASPRRRMSIETVLSWQAFADQSPNLDLKGLLVRDDIGGQTESSLNTDFMQQTGYEDDLLQRFLDNVFIYNPVLEEAVLQQYIREVQFHGLKWDAKSCLLLLIYAHGCLSFSEDLNHPTDSMAFRQTVEFKRAEHFFEAAQKRMGLLLCRSTVVEAQCFFLAGVYLMATLRPLEAWKMFVQALTCCQAFVPEQSAGEDRESEQRLQEGIYWTCFKSELELRLELNVFDNSIWDLTYPAFYPSPPDGLKSQREVVWYYYLAEIALRRLGNRILNTFHRAAASTHHDHSQSQPTIDIDAVSGFEQQASDWLRSLPSVLNFEVTGQSPGGDLVDSLKFILDGHLLDCYEMLYWPFLTEIILHGLPSGTNNNQSQALEQLSLKSLHICVQRIHKNEHGFFARHHGTWLMLRSCTRSALVLLAARKDSVLVNLLPQDWEAAVWKVAKMLRFWRNESRDCEDRLRVIERCMHEIGRRTST